MSSLRVAVLGGGNMGGALVEGILKAGVSEPEDVLVSEIVESRRSELEKQHGIRTTAAIKGASEGADVVIIALKPQILEDGLAPLKGKITQEQTVLSIAAGVTTSRLESVLGGQTRVVRAMPNILAAVGEGAAAICSGKHADEVSLSRAETILSAVGRVVRVTESQMDAVTGLSGSGPGYVFAIIDALADGGVKVGLPKELALTLAAQTVLGAAKMFLDGDKHPAQLKDMVTSPGGTTAAGLAMMDAKGLRDCLISGVEAATLRSIELGK